MKEANLKEREEQKENEFDLAIFDDEVIVALRGSYGGAGF